ncbi:MAG: TrmH family RNA methyltransferase [Brotaphodocola sp.]
MANIIEITDLNIPELDIYTRLSEVQLLRYYEPNGGLFIAESPKVIERALNFGCKPQSLLLERKHIQGEAKEIIRRCGSIPVYTADLDVLSKLTGYPLTRGALCAMYRPILPTVEEVCKDARRIAILEDVVNPTNVGAIFRSAAALNMDAVLLTPACSNPLYRRAVRVSMGTVFQIPWTFLGTKENAWPEPTMRKLHTMGFKTVAMALKEDSCHIDDKKLMSEEKLAILLGTEGDGLAAKTIAACDYTVMIPMSHGVDSLNVAAASAVAFWQLGNKQDTVVNP